MTTYTIKPLEWEWDSRSVGWDAGSGYWKALSPVGIFSIRRTSYGFRWRREGEVAKAADSIGDAKAKAEAYYRERLLTALVPVPDGAQVVEAARNPNPEGRT